MEAMKRHLGLGWLGNQVFYEVLGWSNQKSGRIVGEIDITPVKHVKLYLLEAVLRAAAGAVREDISSGTEESNEEIPMI